MAKRPIQFGGVIMTGEVKTWKEKELEFKAYYDEACEKYEQKYKGSGLTQIGADIARNILHALRTQQMTSYELSEHLAAGDVDKLTLRTILLGTAQMPPARILYKIAVVIGVCPEELVGEHKHRDEPRFYDWNDYMMKEKCRCFCRNVADLTDCARGSDAPARKLGLNLDEYQALLRGEEPLSYSMVTNALTLLGCKEHPELVTCEAKTVPNGYPKQVLLEDGSLDISAIGFNLRLWMQMTMTPLPKVAAASGRTVAYFMELMDGKQPRGGIEELEEIVLNIEYDKRQLLGDDPRAHKDLEPGALVRQDDSTFSVNERDQTKLSTEGSQGKEPSLWQESKSAYLVGAWPGELEPGAESARAASVQDTAGVDVGSQNTLSEEDAVKAVEEILRAIEREHDPRRQAVMKALIEEAARK